jgi:hypothetical protein
VLYAIPCPNFSPTVHDRNIQLWVAAQQLIREHRPAKAASNDEDRNRTIRAAPLRDHFPLEMRVLEHPLRATLTLFAVGYKALSGNWMTKP